MTGHITAGDIHSLGYKSETTYGTPTGNTWDYYADLKGDSGSFTPTDNPNPYVAWRSGSRAYDAADYVATNNEAGFNDVLEVANISNFERIIQNALGASSTAGTPRLPSRTVQFRVTTSQNPNANSLVYYGCKTDRLEIRADQPGGIIEIDETVLASYCQPMNDNTSAISTPTDPAVQWIGGVTIGPKTIYPQNFRIAINNNLGRVKGPVTANDGQAGTVALTEGRIEMELQMDVWMEDLQFIAESGATFTAGATSAITLNIGGESGRNIQMAVRPMADGQHPSIIQDKQMETVRYRIVSMSITTPASS